MATTENTWVDNEVATTALLNNLEDTVIVRCTAAERPTGIEGRRIYETDTNKEYIYDGTTWNLAGGSDWVSFTPSWSGVTVGSGANVGFYRYVAGGMRVRGYWTFGSGSSVAGPVYLTYPNSATTSGLGLTAYQQLGTASIRDNGSATHLAMLMFASSTRATIQAVAASGSYAKTANLSSTLPMTWTNGDQILFDFFVPLST
jgi:hypothetical protein